MKFVKKILIDLDGVLNNYGTEKFDENYIPTIKKGVKNFLKNLKKEECELYLFTTRNKILAVKWLIENKIDKYFKDITSEKLPAYLYVDDRTVCFLGDYSILEEKIKNFKPYYKK